MGRPAAALLVASLSCLKLLVNKLELPAVEVGRLPARSSQQLTYACSSQQPTCVPWSPHRTAGVYIATMMATVQTLQEKGHPYSEICNEVGVFGGMGVDRGCWKE